MASTLSVADAAPHTLPRGRLIAPAFRCLPPPLIIIGMHRSGTSLVSGMLSLMGAYLGPDSVHADADGRVAPPADDLRRNGYGEAEAFRRLNERVLLMAGADWDHVEPFLARRDEPLFAWRCVTAMQLATFAGLRTSYLPPAPAPPIQSWGWKDPRTSLTLEYWLQLFPEAKVLHVRRNPDRIVDSLVRRETARTSGDMAVEDPGFRARLVRVMTDPAYLRRAARKRLGLPSQQAAVHSPEDRGYWYRLSEVYVAECVRFASLSSRYMEIRCEDVVRDPGTVAEQLAHFAGIEPTETAVERAACFVAREPAANGYTNPPRHRPTRAAGSYKHGQDARARNAVEA